jgi:hypothetical protein
MIRAHLGCAPTLTLLKCKPYEERKNLEDPEFGVSNRGDNPHHLVYHLYDSECETLFPDPHRLTYDYV